MNLNIVSDQTNRPILALEVSTRIVGFDATMLEEAIFQALAIPQQGQIRYTGSALQYWTGTAWAAVPGSITPGPSNVFDFTFGTITLS